MKVISLIQEEAILYWKFVKNDLWATIIPGMVITFTAISFNDFSIAYVLKSFLFFNFYVYSFTLTNQFNSIDEDLINKPFRPLPSGLVSKSQVALRIVFSILIFLVISFLFGVFGWAILWTVTHLFLNFIGHKHWFAKNNISMTLGIFAMIGAGWEIVAPLNNSQLTWAIIISIIFGFSGIIQDFRDVEGDRKIGRKTLSIDIGDRNARLLSVGACIISFIIMYLYVIYPVQINILRFLVTFVILNFYLVICIRLIFLKGVKDDHRTYMLLLYLFNLVLLSGIIYL